MNNVVTSHAVAERATLISNGHNDALYVRGPLVYSLSSNVVHGISLDSHYQEIIPIHMEITKRLETKHAGATTEFHALAAFITLVSWIQIFGSSQKIKLRVAGDVQWLKLKLDKYYVDIMIDLTKEDAVDIAIQNSDEFSNMTPEEIEKCTAKVFNVVSWTYEYMLNVIMCGEYCTNPYQLGYVAGANIMLAKTLCVNNHDLYAYRLLLGALDNVNEYIMSADRATQADERLEDNGLQVCIREGDYYYHERLITSQLDLEHMEPLRYVSPIVIRIMSDMDVLLTPFLYPLRYVDIIDYGGIKAALPLWPNTEEEMHDIENWANYAWPEDQGYDRNVENYWNSSLYEFQPYSNAQRTVGAGMFLHHNDALISEKYKLFMQGMDDVINEMSW